MHNLLNQFLTKTAQPNTSGFLNDISDLFFGINGGHLGKYCYNGDNWEDILEDSSHYYIPRADNDLVEKAAKDIDVYLPQNTPYVDFGVGSSKAFIEHALPIIKCLKSKSYTGVDFSADALSQVHNLSNLLGDSVKLSTVEADFFKKIKPPPTSTPSLGVMNGLTLTNMYGTLDDYKIDKNLTRSLSNVSSLSGKGWLLLTMDTNQDELSLHRAYRTKATSRLYLNVFHRIITELDSEGFDANLFDYDPEWHKDIQLFAHMAIATESQYFRLGEHTYTVKKGQKFHLLNSYKFTQNLFESCCDNAGLDVINVWEHDTPVKLYLLMDRRNPYKT